jgi:hypothetical protein
LYVGWTMRTVCSGSKSVAHPLHFASGSRILTNFVGAQMAAFGDVDQVSQ